MSTLVLVTANGSSDAVIARRVGLLARLKVRFHTDALDRRLAAGAAPEEGVSLALRAQTLVAPRMRLQLAQRLHHLAEEARQGPIGGPLSPRAPVRRDVLLEAVDDIVELADKLLEPGPLPVRGLAGARLLLTDGTGPLYDRSTGARLREAVARLLDRLDPMPRPDRPV